MSRVKARKRFKTGDLVEFRYNKKDVPPCVVINVNEKQGEWNKYYSYDILIVEFGVIKDVRGGDIKKWKRNPEQSSEKESWS